MMFRKHIIILFLVLLSSVSFSLANRDNDPVMVIHDTIVAPGELLLQLDALNYTGNNGQVSAITLKIAIDTNLLQFSGIQNQTLSGSWLANYNYQQNEISIIYTAPFGTGYDIDGKLLDLHLFYNGGFSDSLKFKNGCEVSNVSLQNITTIYDNGSVSQVNAVGNVYQDSVIINWGEEFLMPVIAGGAGYDAVNELCLRQEYDSSQLQYLLVQNSLLSNISVSDTNSVLSFSWQDNSDPVNLTTDDTLFYVKYKFIGDTNCMTAFLPGSKVYNNGQIVASGFNDGYITAKYLVKIIKHPDTAGTVTGEGYYFEEDTVTVIATPSNGYHFKNWVLRDSIVSEDSLYSYVKEPLNDTLTANFNPNTYYVTLSSSPPEGGYTTGDGPYFYGESVTVSAVSNIGYDFVCWLSGGDTTSYEPDYTFTMPDHDVSMTAVFELQSFSITAVSNNINYGTASGGGIYNYGDTATVIGTPNPDYRFVAWTENGQVVSYDSSYSFFVDSDRELFANFQFDSDCSAPVSLYADSLSDSTAMLSWVASGQENEWDLIWGTYGFDTVSEGELVPGLTETHYFLENLEAGTTYDFYVRAVCTDEVHSIWAGPYTFTTWYVGLHNKPDAKKINLYPNPADKNIFVVIDNGVYPVKKYIIINILGQSKIHQNIIPVRKFNINVSQLPKGRYFLHLITTNGESVVKSFIKK